jgi:DNA-binding XRE family transcriptional regulator
MKNEKIKQLAVNAVNKEAVLALLKANQEILEELTVLQIMQASTNKNELSALISKSNVPKELIGDDQALKEYLITRVAELRREYLKNHSFALPSDSIMFSLLSLFSGKPKRIPKDKLISSVISNEAGKKTINSSGNLVSETQKIGILKDSIKVHATASLDDIKMFDDESLAVYIKKTFGPEGLRHFLAMIIGIEENMRKGYLEWDVNKHLERLGYKRKSGGSYKPELKQMAIDMVQLLASLIFVVHRKDKKNEKVIDLQRLFTLPGAKIYESSGWESVTIRAEEFWYTLPTSGKSQYTKLLKKIVKESHSQQPLTIILAPILAIFWRIEGKKKLSVRKLMHWCDLDTESHFRLRELRNLEDELEYMQRQKYLGSWNHNGESILPSDCDDPMNVVFTLEPPAWLQKELVKISDKAAEFKQLPNSKQITNDQFKKIYQESGLKKQEFAAKIKTSVQTINKLLSGRQTVSNRISIKVEETFLKPNRPQLISKSTPPNKQTDPT